MLRSCLWYFSFLQLREDVFHVVSCEVFVHVVVDLHDGGVGASTQALDLREGEASVGGRLKVADTQRFFDALLNKVAAAQHTGGRSAALEVVFSYGFAVDHRVEAGDLFQTQARQRQHRGDRLHGGIRDAVRARVLPLRKVEQCEHGTLLATFGILGELIFGTLGKRALKGKAFGGRGRGRGRGGGGRRSHRKRESLKEKIQNELSVDFAEDDVERS